MAKARSARRDLGLIANGLVHKLRNSLNTLQTQIAILEKLTAAEPNGPVSRQILSLAEGVMRMENVLQQFQNYASPPRRRSEIVNLSSLVEQVLDVVKREFEQANIWVKRELPRNLPPVFIDAGQVRLAIVNILANAREAMPSGGKLVVRTQLGLKRTVFLEVSDSGCGIPLENRRQIAQPFFSTKPGGLGLGLSIAKRIIKNQGGRLSFDSMPDQGTTFRIRLPMFVGAGTGPQKKPSRPDQRVLLDAIRRPAVQARS